MPGNDLFLRARLLENFKFSLPFFITFFYFVSMWLIYNFEGHYRQISPRSGLGRSVSHMSRIVTFVIAKLMAEFHLNSQFATLNEKLTNSLSSFSQFTIRFDYRLLLLPGSFILLTPSTSVITRCSARSSKVANRTRQFHNSLRAYQLCL